MDLQFQPMEPAEVRKRLDRYKELSGIRTDREIAERLGKSAATLSSYVKSKGLTSLIELQDLTKALDLPIDIFRGSFDVYSRYLEDSLTARWRDIIGCTAYRTSLENAITYEATAARLVQPISNRADKNYPEIKIGSSNRLKIDLLALLRDQGIVQVQNDEVSFNGFEPSNGNAPLQDFFIYVLQIERTGCILLRPNSEFSLADDPRDNEDILRIEDLDNPCESMNGLLYIPAPSKGRPSYMVFGGEPGLSRIVILLARWPAIYLTLKKDLSDPNGADLRLLDELAANLKPSANETDPSSKSYWRIYDQAYELVR